MNEWQFLMTYSVFLFFFMAMLGLGAGSYIADGYNATAPVTPPEPSSDPLGTLLYVVENIGLFFGLMVLNPLSPIGFLGWIITMPAIIVLIYIVIKLIRGGG